MNILKSAMSKDPATKIKYASKYARLTNYYKKWQGENMGLKQTGAIKKKEKEEKRLASWTKATGKHLNVFESLKSFYDKSHSFELSLNVCYEAGLGIDLIYFSYLFNRFIDLYEHTGLDNEGKILLKEKYLKRFKKLYKDFDKKTDKALANTLLPIMVESLDKINIKKDNAFLINSDIFSKSLTPYIEKLYSKSFLADSTKTFNLIKN